MCASCGCALGHLSRADDAHGDSRNITITDLRCAAEAAGISTGKAIANITATVAGTARDSKPKAAGFRVVKADPECRFLLTVAYSPNRLPARGADGYLDVVSPDVLEKAAWRFMDNGHEAGLWHEEGHAQEARVVESSIYRGPHWVIKATDGSEQVIEAGDWLVGFILSDAAWGLYKSGRIGGASPQGGASRRLASTETLARQRS